MNLSFRGFCPRVFNRRVSKVESGVACSSKDNKEARLVDVKVCLDECSQDGDAERRVLSKHLFPPWTVRGKSFY